MILGQNVELILDLQFYDCCSIVSKCWGGSQSEILPKQIIFLDFTPKKYDLVAKSKFYKSEIL